MANCASLRSADGDVEFSIFGTIICGPGANSDDRKTDQLHAAIKAVDLERAMLCLTKGTPVDTKDKGGWTPLQRAVQNDSIPAVRFLLKHGADPTLETPDGRGVLDLTSVHEEMHAILTRFMSGKSSRNASQIISDEPSPTGVASPGSTGVLTGVDRTGSQSASSSGAALMRVNSSGAKKPSSPMSQEAKNAKLATGVFFSDVEECRDALKLGADVHSRDASGMTPLLWAANKGSLEVATLLLEHGAKGSLDVRNSDGWTALHWACYSGHLEIAQLLLRYGADASLENKHGRRPVEMARTDAIRHALLSGAGAAQNAPASPADAQPAVGAEEDEEEEYPQAELRGSPNVDPHAARPPAGPGAPSWGYHDPAKAGAAIAAASAMNAASMAAGTGAAFAGAQPPLPRGSRSSDPDGFRIVSARSPTPDGGRVSPSLNARVVPPGGDPTLNVPLMTEAQRQRADALRNKLEKIALEAAAAQQEMAAEAAAAQHGQRAGPAPVPLPQGWLTADGDDADDA